MSRLSALTETNKGEEVMEGPFWVFLNILNTIETVRKCEDRCIAQFGDSSDIAAQANMVTRETLGLLMTVTEKFHLGIVLSPGETHRLAETFLGEDQAVPDQNTAKELTDRLKTHTDGVVQMVLPENSPEGGTVFRMIFNKE